MNARGVQEFGKRRQFDLTADDIGSLMAGIVYAKLINLRLAHCCDHSLAGKPAGPHVGLLSVADDYPAEFGTRVDAELAVDASQVGFDGFRADEHRGGDVAVGHAGGRQFCDALFGRREQRLGSGPPLCVPTSLRVRSVHNAAFIRSNAAIASVNVVVAVSFWRCRRWSWPSSSCVRARSNGMGNARCSVIARCAMRVAASNSPCAANIMLRHRAPMASVQAGEVVRRGAPMLRSWVGVVEPAERDHCLYGIRQERCGGDFRAWQRARKRATSGCKSC